MRSSGQPVIDVDFEDEAAPRGDLEQASGGMSDAAMMLSSGHSIQRVQTQYTGAIACQRPRDPEKVLEACLKEARLCGPDFYYRWTVKDRKSPTGESIVEGTSIDGAMILARNFGNCAIPTELVQETPMHWILQATFVDLETGFNVPRLYRQRKSQKSGDKMDGDRAQDIAFQIGQSKAQRNAIVKAMPVWLLTKCFEAAEQVEIKKYQDVAKFAPKYVDAYARIGVSKARLEKKVGRVVDAWEPRDVALLAAIARAIKEGTTTIENEFPAEGVNGTPVDEQKSSPTPETRESTPPPAPPQPETTAPEPPPAAAASDGMRDGHSDAGDPPPPEPSQGAEKPSRRGR